MKDNAVKVDLFETMPIPKAVFNLCIPAVISSLVMILYSMADTYFVGMLNNSVQNAAVTLSSPALTAFYGVTNLFGVGASSMMSRALGRKDVDTVRRSSAFGFYMALFFGLLYSTITLVFSDSVLDLLGCTEVTKEATWDYMKWAVVCGAAPAILNNVLAQLVRSEGAALHSSLGTMSGCLLNIALDPIFILPWGLDMGAGGAGCATFISNMAACLYFFILLHHKKGRTYISLSPKYFGFRKTITLGIISVGVPVAIQNILNVTGMTILNNFTSSYGADAVAAMGIAQRLNQVIIQMAMGFGQGIMPLISYNYSAYNTDRMKKCLYYTFKVQIIVISAFLIVYFTKAEWLVSLFMEKAIIIEYGSKLLYGLSAAVPFLIIDFTCVGMYSALGMGKYAFLFAIARKILLEIPALVILNRIWPLYGLSYAQLTAEFILAIVAMIQVRRIFRRLTEREQQHKLYERNHVN